MHTPSSIDDRSSLRACLLFAGVVMLGFGLLYSVAGAGLGRALFPAQAAGRMLEHNGSVVGSALVAQSFEDVRYFQPRPSAAGYDPMAAAGSNLARTNPALRQRIQESVTAVALRDGITEAEVPGELVTQSGAGLDPHLSPGGVQVQIARVAKARSVSVADVTRLVDAHTEGAQFGLLGPERINVLRLNIALDSMHPGR